MISDRKHGGFETTDLSLSLDHVQLVLPSSLLRFAAPGLLSPSRSSFIAASFCCIHCIKSFFSHNKSILSHSGTWDEFEYGRASWARGSIELRRFIMVEVVLTGKEECFQEESLDDVMCILPQLKYTRMYSFVQIHLNTRMNTCSHSVCLRP